MEKRAWPAPVPLEKRFWPKVQQGAPTECWEWQASLDTGGYGHIGAGPGRPLKRAHRVAYELTHGEIPPGLVVCHRCDNRRCCNPAHLFLGRQRDNIVDMISKGRRQEPVGVANPRAKLTEQQVKAIRADRRPRREILAEYGISGSTYHALMHRQTWSHV